MHGRLKVRSTAEQAERKRQEQQARLAKYQAAMARAWDKRTSGECDDEALQLTGKLLSANSDLATIWNYRKETLQSLAATREPEKAQAMWEGDLHFTEQCLKDNPKSYGTWHHRQFVLQNMPEPNWQRELKLCNKFLEYDERNFHCWDYRRFVIPNAEVSPEDELKFTSDKIEANFSNFSCWHYRSKLLPVVRPKLEAGDQADASVSKGSASDVNEPTIMEEFELAQNAFFTDPGDQSAWFYHRWLMSAGERRATGLLACHVVAENQEILLSFTKPLKLKCEDVTVAVGDHELSTKAVTRAGGHGRVWSCTVEAPDAKVLQERPLCARVNTSDGQLCADVTDGDGWLQSADGHVRPLPGSRDLLEQQLAAIRELQQVEPENKWVLLCLVSLTRALDPLDDSTLTLLDQLTSIDPMRKNYYADMRSSFILESMLPVTSPVVSFSGKSLTSFPIAQFLTGVTRLDISENQLTSLAPISALRLLTHLDAHSNRLTSSRGITDLPRLQEADLGFNEIADQKSIRLLKRMPTLVTIRLAGNPCCPVKTEDSD